MKHSAVAVGNLRPNLGIVAYYQITQRGVGYICVVHTLDLIVKFKPSECVWMIPDTWQED